MLNQKTVFRGIMLCFGGFLLMSVCCRVAGSTDLINIGRVMPISTYLNISGLMFVSDSRVGIGISSPLEELDVAGDIKYTGALKIFNGATQVGEITTTDTTWLRINQNVAKNIYTPRYIRADEGLYVDGTTYGIDGSGILKSNTGATIGGNTAWHAGNDGSGSGLDADLLDGQHGSYYYPASNPYGFYNSTSIPSVPDSWVNATGDSMSGQLTMSGTSANIALGSNYLSGDGGDEGVFVAGDGDVGIGTNSPTAGAKLDVLGSIASNSFTTRVESGEGIHITSPGGARFATTTTTVTGAIKITLPVSWTSTMMRMTVKVYEYSADESFTVELGGYNYGGAYWVNTFAQIVGSKSDRDFSVKFGHDGTKCAIWIGENTSTWSYPQVEVSDFYAGYSQYAVDTWNDGWSISFDANFSGDTFTASESDNFPYSDWNKLKNIPSGIGDGVDAYIGNSGAHTSGGSLNMNNNAITNINWGGSDDGSGSGLDADLLDGHDTSYFQTAITNPVTGTGTANYITKWTGTTSVGNSVIYETGGNVGIGTTAPGSYKLNVNGGIYANSISGLPRKTFRFSYTNTVYYYLIAKLPATSSNTGDALMIETTGLQNSIQGKGKLKVAIGQREGFWYRKAYDGGNPRVHVVVYKQPDNTSNVYVYIPSPSYTSGEVLYYQYGWTGVTLYDDPVASTTVPSGTLIFDSNDEVTYPVNDVVNTGTGYFRNNVGIGTTSPGAKLAINGGVHIGGDSDPGDNNLLVDGDLTVNGGDISIGNNNGGINFNDASAYWMKTATNWGIYWDTSANAIEFHGAGTDRANIDLDTGDAQFNGDLTVKGGDVKDSGGSNRITFSGTNVIITVG